MDSSTIALTPLPTFFPMIRGNPGHEIQDTPVVLDLCIKKRPPSPNFPHDYPYCQKSTSLSCTSPKSEISDISSTDLNANITPMGLKRSRPFKAYPKDPVSIALMGSPVDNIFGEESAKAFTEFRQKMLSQVQGSHNGTNKNMRRSQSNNPHNSDPSYWEKRKKNNEAAKRSRDARRAKEDEIAIRCAFLEQENIQLKFRIAALKNERERFESIVYK
ncbi:hypothetical protein JTB14_010182 [Gonioctena quinquepunctata]|nr:hypothetical protein JTB14_010182 [Gonioctena quinquepunctata]